MRLRRLRTCAREVVRLLGVSPIMEREVRTAGAKAGRLTGPVDELPALKALKATLPQTSPPQQVSTVS